MNRLRVSILQTDIAWENKQDNLRRLREQLETLRGATEIVVLPVTFSTGFSMNTDRLAEPVTDKTIATLRQWAAECQIALAGSYISCDEIPVASEDNELSYKHPAYYNRAFFLTPEGESYFYDKRHLFRMGHETEHFTAGSQRAVISYRGWNILLLVCYDLRFPVWSRNVDNEYDLLIYVANWPVSRRKVWDILLQARALEKDRRPDCTARVRGGGLSLLSITNFLIAGKRVLQVGKAHQLAPKENRSVIAVFTYC